MIHGSSFRLPRMLLLTLLSSQISCVTLHRVGRLANYHSQQEKEHHSQKAVKIATHPFIGNQSSQQILAMEIVGQLKVNEPSNINMVLDFLIDQPKSTALYHQTIWTLGELSRNLDWDSQSQRIHQVLLQELLQSQNASDIAYLGEALTKNYIGHRHSIEEDVQTVNAIHAVMSKKITISNGLLTLQKELQTLPVLITLLQNNLNLPQQDQNQLYTSTLELLRYFESHRNILSQQQYAEQIQDTLNTSLELLTEGEQAVQLLTLWMLAHNATDALLSEMVVTYLLQQVHHPDQNFDIMLHYALIQMRDSPQVREYLRTLFQENQSLQLWSLLEYQNNDSLDLIQELYGISVQQSTQGMQHVP